MDAGGQAHDPDGGGRGVDHRPPRRGARARGIRHAGKRNGQGSARAYRACAARPGVAGRDAPGRLGLRRLPAAARALPRPHHHAHGAGRGDRSDRRARARGGRLRGQAVQRSRGCRSHQGGATPDRGRGVRGARRPARGGPRAARSRPAERQRRGSAARADPQGVRAAGAPPAGGRQRRLARASDRRGLGRELVRLHEDSRRARLEPATEARRRLRRSPLHPHPARRGLPLGAAGRLDDPDQLEELVRNASERLGGRVIVVDRNGRLLVDSAGAGLRSTSYATRPEIARALAGQPSQGTRHSDSLGEDLLFTAVPVVRASRPAGAVRVTQSVDAVQGEVRTDVIALVAGGVGALLLGLGVAWLLAGSLAKPLRGLARTARRVAGGDLDARARVEGSAEQREVASAFNDMTGRLARALRSQQEFVANASHQLRTPLTGLRLRLEAAALKVRDPAVERELQAAERETERLARLLAELLTLARERERPAAEPVDLADVAEAARERWAGPAERSGHVLRVNGDGPAVVASTYEDLGVIVDNLLENAIHYSPPGTTVTIEWGGGGAARLAVLDEGPGVAAEERERVFERFYRGGAAGGTAGTGLGLSVVEALARRWGGEVSLENRAEGGARVEVTMPLHPEALPGAEPALDEALPKGA